MKISSRLPSLNYAAYQTIEPLLPLRPTGAIEPVTRIIPIEGRPPGTMSKNHPLRSLFAGGVFRQRLLAQYYGAGHAAHSKQPMLVTRSLQGTRQLQRPEFARGASLQAELIARWKVESYGSARR